MKIVLRVLVLLLPTILIFTCCEKKPEPKKVFPDTYFLNALIGQGVDTNNDSIISPAEAEAITDLFVVFDDISDLTGIELFVNLETLRCYGNKLTTLDVSNNTALVTLNLNSIPTLYEVCVWEMPFPPAGVEMETTNSPNVFFTTDCTGGK